MIETYFGMGGLDSAGAFFAALAIGLVFGFLLERAGFGSSRRLAGIFYFRDMAVVKVMFTALITGMLGLCYLNAFGWIAADQLYFMPTVYGAQIFGGLLFGVGFVMSGWCPGTGAVGLASGKIDALIFFFGAILGSILFNELFPIVKPLYGLGGSGVRFVHESLHLSRPAFALAFTLIAVGCFWGSEYIEKIRSGSGGYFNSPFLRAFSLALLVAAGGLFLFPASPPTATIIRTEAAVSQPPQPDMGGFERDLLAAIEAGADHMAPAELADRLMQGEADLLLVDVRTADEFRNFHIRGALNVPLPQLAETLAPYKNKGLIVLYSNGMTHPAQARDSLFRLGFHNVYLLTDGLRGFFETCLKPASLRGEPLPPAVADKIGAWRTYFLAAQNIPETQGK